MKKTISAEIIADSKNEHGQRITSFVLTFPRFILAEFNTHRTFSRNSASSRAIPFNKMVKMVEEDPFIPIAWQKDHKGMQGTEYATDEADILQIENRWLGARDAAVRQASDLAMHDVTKQLCNRLLEPFMWHTAIVTATEFENFFKLRCPQYSIHTDPETEVTGRSWKDILKADYTGDFKDASDTYKLQRNKGQGEIHIMALAEAMWDAMNESTPQVLQDGEWHIPFGDKFDEDRIYDLFDESGGDPDKYVEIERELIEEAKVKIATARCARLSYMNFEGKDDYEADIKLHDILFKSGHYSPFEHCARAMGEKDELWLAKGDSQDPIFIEEYNWSGNFRGFVQYRKEIES